MPFKSDAQRKLMYFVHSNPKRAKELGIKLSPKVAKEFIKAEHTMKYPKSMGKDLAAAMMGNKNAKGKGRIK